MNSSSGFFKVVFVVLFCFIVTMCKHTIEKVNVLVLIPLSGSAASYGKVQKQGVEVALDELKKNQFHDKLNIIFADSKMSPREAVSILHQETARRNISVVIGFSTAEVLALSKVCNEKKILLVAPLASGDKISSAGSYVYRISPSDSFQGVELVKAVLKGKKSNVAVLYVNDAWGKGLSGKFVEEYNKNAAEISTIESCNPNQSDLRTQLLKIKESGSDAVVFILHPGEVLPALKQSKELGITAQIYGGDTFSHKSIYTEGLDLAQGVIFTLPSQPDNPTFENFRKIYNDKFSAQADVNAAAIRDAIMVVVEALKGGATDGESFRRYLSTLTKGYQGATGLISWDKNGDVISKEYGIYIIENGAYRAVEE